MTSRRSLLAGALGASAAGCALGGPRSHGGASAPPGPRAARFPNVSLVTHRGRPVRFYDDCLRGKTVLVNFMYASCTKSCPGTTANLVEVQRLLGDRVGRDVFMYSLSVTPEQDTPDVLRAYAERHGVRPSGWEFLTGADADVDLVRRALGFVDPNPEVDAVRTNHAGILRYGNEPRDRWAACPAMTRPTEIVRAVGWVIG